MHPSWKTFLKEEFKKPYFQELSDFLQQAYISTTVFPPKGQVFRAFSTDLNQVSVVILGQDPYHTPKAAHGLAFSVPIGQPIPPSLKNIYKEIDQDFASLKPPITRPQIERNGDLSTWQQQGVFLLNNVLTVEAHRAGSHRGKGWEIFTEATIRYLNKNRPHLVFLLWGRDARSKAPMIDRSKHLVLESAHPSPLSAHAGFFGNHHFSKANDFLRKHKMSEIVW